MMLPQAGFSNDPLGIYLLIVWRPHRYSPDPVLFFNHSLEPTTGIHEP